MKRFSDFEINVETDLFIGDKIKIAKVLNREITIKAYKIDQSKFVAENNPNKVTMHIVFEEEDRIIFSGSKTLMRQLDAVPKENFPILAVIEKNGETYKLT